MKSLTRIALLICLYGFGQDDTTSRFEFSGEFRTRYESLDGQFRKSKSGSDQLLLFRTLLHPRYITSNVQIGLEIQDSRTYLGGSNTPLSSSYTNTADILQLYGQFRIQPLLNRSSKAALKIGRQTVSISSKRQIERVTYANVIRAYSGVYYLEKSTRNNELHLFYTVPVTRLPKDKDLLFDNHFEWDSEALHQHVWGAHYRVFEPLGKSLQWAEFFIYGYDEKDTRSKKTPNRLYVAPGFRLFQPYVVNGINYDIEGAYRFGSRRSSSEITDLTDLKVRSSMLIAKLGYTFLLPLKVNVAIQHYFASGDKDPNDNTYGQFERMFGGRRTDLNNTSIHGPLTPANLSATGVRVELLPEKRWDARLHYSYVNLASATDQFIIGKYQDPSGESGRFLGHTIDTRARLFSNDKKWILDAGASAFIPGYYTKSVRAEEDITKTTWFGYIQLVVGL